MTAKINWVGLAGGSLTIAAVAASFYIPWWSLSVDVNSQVVSVEGFLRAGISPLNTNLTLMGTPLSIPLLTSLNIVGLLSMLLSGVVMLIYSVLPTKPYAKHLLGFAYKKPLLVLIFFVASLLAVSALAQAFANTGVPLNGSATLTLPESIGGGGNASILISTGFLLSFWLTIVAAGLCIGARIYHGMYLSPKKTETKPAEPTTPKEEVKPAEPAPPKEEPKPAQPAASKEEPKQAEQAAPEKPPTPPATSP
jgi:hypothetical protein